MGGVPPPQAPHTQSLLSPSDHIVCALDVVTDGTRLPSLYETDINVDVVNTPAPVERESDDAFMWCTTEVNQTNKSPDSSSP